MYERTAVRSKFIIAILWKKLPKIIKGLLQVAHDLRVVFFIFRKTGSFDVLFYQQEMAKKKSIESVILLLWDWSEVSNYSEVSNCSYNDCTVFAYDQIKFVYKLPVEDTISHPSATQILQQMNKFLRNIKT